MPPENDFRLGHFPNRQRCIVDKESQMIAVAQKAVAMLDETPLYARIDMLLDVNKNIYVISEVEIVESCLLLENDPNSYTVLGAAITRRLSHNGQGKK